MANTPHTSALSMIERALDTRFFHPEGGQPAVIPFHFVPGSDPLLVVLGPNAGGKSFFRRVLMTICQEQQTEAIHISMEGRRRTGERPWLAMVYGDEMYHSTGVNSINTVLTGISTCRSRNQPHVVIWDEPDIGMSEGAAASVGRAIAEFAAAPPASLLASVVITHRKALVAELATCRPHYLHLGTAEAPASLEAWLAAPPDVRPLESIRNEAHARFLRLRTLLKE